MDSRHNLGLDEVEEPRPSIDLPFHEEMYEFMQSHVKLGGSGKRMFSFGDIFVRRLETNPTSLDQWLKVGSYTLTKSARHKLPDTTIHEERQLERWGSVTTGDRRDLHPTLSCFRVELAFHTMHIVFTLERAFTLQ